MYRKLLALAAGALLAATGIVTYLHAAEHGEEAASEAPVTPLNLHDEVRDAIRAGPPSVAVNATIKGWEGDTLQEGSNDYACYPTPPGMDNGPMCLDAVWEEWAEAWANQEPFETDRLGIAYMLMGDTGASNIDPYAEEATADNDWVIEGPHLMLIVPDEAMLEGITTDPTAGGPYVMWKDTPYAHIMVPLQ